MCNDVINEGEWSRVHNLEYVSAKEQSFENWALTECFESYI